MRFAAVIVALVIAGCDSNEAPADTRVLFIGNSFTFGFGASAQFYRAWTVTDLNGDGKGGMPALFKSFADQAGLSYDVFLETEPGSGLDYHLDNKLGVIGNWQWDTVVMHGYSTLDPGKPRDPNLLIDTSTRMAEHLRTGNPQLQLYLMATWSRADQVYPSSGAWAGESIDAMARDVRAAYDAAAASAGAAAVIPVGEAWNRAMHDGVADPDPYDGIDANKVSLWTYDHYHASNFGLYLEALVVFGTLTGVDPRSLGENECSAFELGFSRMQAAALQQIAAAQLQSEALITAAPAAAMPELPPRQPCAAAR